MRLDQDQVKQPPGLQRRAGGEVETGGGRLGARGDPKQTVDLTPHQQLPCLLIGLGGVEDEIAAVFEIGESLSGRS